MLKKAKPLIFRCPSCDKRNSLSSDIRNPGVYLCGSCRSPLLKIESAFWHAFLFEAVSELQSIEASLGQISKPYFEQFYIDDLQVRANHAQSVIKVWKEHLDLIEPEDRPVVYRPYSPVLMEACSVFARLEEAIDNKRVFKNFASFFAQMQAVLFPMISLLNLVLPVFGLAPIRFATKLLPKAAAGSH